MRRAPQHRLQTARGARERLGGAARLWTSGLAAPARPSSEKPRRASCPTASPRTRSGGPSRPSSRSGQAVGPSSRTTRVVLLSARSRCPLSSVLPPTRRRRPADSRNRLAGRSPWQRHGRHYQGPLSGRISPRRPAPQAELRGLPPASGAQPAGCRATGGSRGSFPPLPEAVSAAVAAPSPGSCGPRGCSRRLPAACGSVGLVKP